MTTALLVLVHTLHRDTVHQHETRHPKRTILSRQLHVALKRQNQSGSNNHGWSLPPWLRGLNSLRSNTFTIYSRVEAKLYLRIYFNFNFMFFHPIYYIRASFSLPPINSRNSDTGSHSRLFSPLPNTARALHSYTRTQTALSLFSQVAERGVRRHGGCVNHPLPRRSPGLRVAVGIRHEEGRSGETTGFM